MNKVDQLPEEGRAKVISKAKKRLSQTLNATKFAGCAMVPTAVKPGGTYPPPHPHTPLPPPRSAFTEAIQSPSLPTIFPRTQQQHPCIKLYLEQDTHLANKFRLSYYSHSQLSKPCLSHTHFPMLQQHLLTSIPILCHAPCFLECARMVTIAILCRHSRMARTDTGHSRADTGDWQMCLSSATIPNRPLQVCNRPLFCNQGAGDCTDRHNFVRHSQSWRFH